jgi:hypothetical protein
MGSSHFEERVFLSLTAVFLTHTADPQLQWAAVLVLKNTLKDHLVQIREHSPEELTAIKRALFLVLQSE